MACKRLGMIDWSGSTDVDGHRTYKIKWKVRCLRRLDGPAQALATPGLPIPGISTWNFDNDIDDEAYCHPNQTATPMLTDDPDNINFIVEQTFSTKPPDRKENSCENEGIKNPLAQPPRASGGFVRYKTEEAFDRFDRPIVNSAFEQYEGPQVEFDDGHPIIRIDQNVLNLDLPTLCMAQDTLNALSLWGLPPRTIKLSDFTWETMYYGSCYQYFRRTLEFEIMFDFRQFMAQLGMNRQQFVAAMQSGNIPALSAVGITADTIQAIADRMMGNTPRKSWDKYLLDDGTKALQGEWNEAGEWELIPVGLDENNNPVMPDPDNPQHYMKFVDKSGNPARVILNGAGMPAAVKTINRKYWWITRTTWGDVGLPFYGTCSEAAQFQRSNPNNVGEFSDQIYGPFDTDAEMGRNGSPITTCQTWNGPGINIFQKYEEFDFLLLGIPVDISYT